MYNRYIPSEDGTYRRQVVEERCGKREPPPAKPAAPPQKKPAPRPQPSAPAPRAPLSLFCGMDTADLLILLILLLLMTDDGSDNTSLIITIALYFLLQ